MLYQSELIRNKGPWAGVTDLEIATAEYLDWFNHRRLHGGITDDTSYITPAEHEATHYRQNRPVTSPVTQ